jgi:AraC-like DNA-binding protein/ligand-binding sensor protein
METRIDICRYFTAISGIGMTILNREGETLFNTPHACGTAAFCDLLNTDSVSCERCRMTQQYGASQARRFGGRYIFFCHRGLTHFTSPVVINGRIQYSLVAGPFLMTDYDDYLRNEAVAYMGEQADPPEMELVVEKIMELQSVKPQIVQALSELLYYSALYLGKQSTEYSVELIQNDALPHVIAEYIDKINLKGEIGFYPLQKEDELLAAMASGDIKAAKSMLNELLGFIFFYSGLQFDVIRSRVLELIVLLSRAAVRGGADAELIFGLNYEYLKEINTFDNVEDLTYWLSMIMNRFTDYVFRFVNAKHADVIYKAIEYMKARYMGKLPLEEVAKTVFLSPAYFSRIFKLETGSNFSSYLNRIRIEESKKLLRNPSINLADIAGMVGFEDQSYFSKVFKKVSGISPLKFRQSRLT